MSNYYHVLGLNRNASSEQIKQAHRKLALEHHPDKNPGKEGDATIQFYNIQLAYEVLTDPVRRQKHNEGLSGSEYLDLQEQTPRPTPPRNAGRHSPSPSRDNPSPSWQSKEFTPRWARGLHTHNPGAQRPDLGRLTKTYAGVFAAWGTPIHNSGPQANRSNQSQQDNPNDAPFKPSRERKKPSSNGFDPRRMEDEGRARFSNYTHSVPTPPTPPHSSPPMEDTPMHERPTAKADDIWGRLSEGTATVQIPSPNPTFSPPAELDDKLPTFKPTVEDATDSNGDAMYIDPDEAPVPHTSSPRTDSAPPRNQNLGEIGTVPDFSTTVIPPTTASVVSGNIFTATEAGSIPFTFRASSLHPTKPNTAQNLVPLMPTRPKAPTTDSQHAVGSYSQQFETYCEESTKTFRAILAHLPSYPTDYRGGNSENITFIDYLARIKESKAVIQVLQVYYEEYLKAIAKYEKIMKVTASN
ncbi:DnaJ domain-containing protein [Phaeosphaeriaceae sp. PMI808]|nr:DnaJ domain-containing protein [Phaeosphaeriaceae sp. PMI808]